VVIDYGQKLAKMSSLLPLFEQIARAGRPLLILAEEVEGEVPATLIVNKLRGTLNACAVRAPGLGDRRRYTKPRKTQDNWNLKPPISTETVSIIVELHALQIVAGFFEDRPPTSEDRDDQAVGAEPFHQTGDLTGVFSFHAAAQVFVLKPADVELAAVPVLRTGLRPRDRRN
jgi:hypothetical protein